MIEKKILICDDDDGILDMLSLILEDNYSQVSTEVNSLNTINLIIELQPDLLILDLWMPVISGDQILGIIRSTKEMANLPVIVISASKDGEKIAMDAGATRYLPKPFDVDELLSIMGSMLDDGIISKLENLSY